MSITSGQVRARFDGSSIDMVDGEKTVLTAAGALKDARFWSPEDPYLYDVYTILTVDGKTVDVNKVVTGFRKTEFKGGAGTGGVYLNDKFVYLKGFAQRSSNEWAGLGGAYPDWLHDFTRPSCCATAMATTCAGCTLRRSASMPIPSTALASFKSVPEATRKGTR